MRRVLVTGARGFLGAHCIGPLIDKGFEVHVASRSGAAAVSGATCHGVDLMDAAAVRSLMANVRPTHLLHLAWETEPGKFWSSARNVSWTTASLELFKSFADHGGRRFVGAGSCAEYDWSYQLLDDVTTPCTPASKYGQAKNATRELLAGLSRSSGISFAWGRVFFLYGPCEKRGRLVSDVVVSLLKKLPVATSDGRQIRDYMYVVDVAAAFAALLDSAIEGAVNIASGEPRTVKDILSAIGRATGRTDLIGFGERPVPEGEPLRLEASVKRLFNDVGFCPSYSLDQGVQATVDWWRKALAGSGRAGNQINR